MSREVLQMALEAMENTDRSKLFELEKIATTAIKEVLARPVQLEKDRLPKEVMQRAINEVKQSAESVLLTAQSIQPEQWTSEDMAYRPGGMSLTD